ncbi:hypothetical protein CVT26_015988, partial [Gymnopilus dilepis]
KFELHVRTSVVFIPPPALLLLLFPSPLPLYVCRRLWRPRWLVDASIRWPSFTPQDPRCDVAAANAASSNWPKDTLLCVAAAAVNATSTLRAVYPAVEPYERRGCQRTLNVLGCHDLLTRTFSAARHCRLLYLSSRSSPLHCFLLLTLVSIMPVSSTLLSTLSRFADPVEYPAYFLIVMLSCAKVLITVSGGEIILFDSS